MLIFNFHPFPVLETKRLILRRVTKEDAETFLRLRNTDEVMQYIDRPRQKNEEEIIALINQIDEKIDSNKDINWGISLKENPTQLLGTTGFYRTIHEHHRGEIGYMLDANFWRKGIMQEAIEKVLEYGFTELKFNTITGYINPNNIASREILLKNGFIKEAYFKEDYLWNGVFKDTEVYTKFSR